MKLVECATMIFMVFFVATVSCAIWYYQEQNFAETLKYCYIASLPKPEQCFYEYFLYLKTILASMVPVSPMDSTIGNIHLESLHLFNGSDVFSGIANLNNFTINGCENYLLDYIKFDFSKKSLVLEVTVPELSSRGFYKLDGTLLNLPVVKSAGVVNVKFSDAKVVLTLILDFTGCVGTVKLVDTKINIESANLVTYYLDNSLVHDNSNELLETTSKFVEENSKLIGNELKQCLSNKLNSVFQTLIEPFINEWPRAMFYKVQNSSLRFKI